MIAIWSMLSFIQIVTHLSLINVSFPEGVTQLLSNFIGISKLNMIPKDKVSNILSSLVENSLRKASNKVQSLDIF